MKKEPDDLRTIYKLWTHQDIGYEQTQENVNRLRIAYLIKILEDSGLRYDTSSDCVRINNRGIALIMWCKVFAAIAKERGIE